MDMANLTWLHGQQQSIGMLKANPEDFMIVEELGFEPDSEGEHVLVNIRKTGCNTQFVAGSPGALRWHSCQLRQLRSAERSPCGG